MVAGAEGVLIEGKAGRVPSSSSRHSTRTESDRLIVGKRKRIELPGSCPNDSLAISGQAVAAMGRMPGGLTLVPAFACRQDRRSRATAQSDTQ